MGSDRIRCTMSLYSKFRTIFSNLRRLEEELKERFKVRVFLGYAVVQAM